jgi:hypothetical protein
MILKCRQFIFKFYRFYRVPVTDKERSTIYSQPLIQEMLRKIGFVEEIGEYVLDSGITSKMSKIKKWMKRGIMVQLNSSFIMSI